MDAEQLSALLAQIENLELIVRAAGPSLLAAYALGLAGAYRLARGVGASRLASVVAGLSYGFVACLVLFYICFRLCVV